jgi:hypothetical protein
MDGTRRVRLELIGGSFHGTWVFVPFPLPETVRLAVEDGEAAVYRVQKALVEAGQPQAVFVSD